MWISSHGLNATLGINEGMWGGTGVGPQTREASKPTGNQNV